MKSQVIKRVAATKWRYVGFSHVRTLTHDAREGVPVMLINNKPLKAATRPSAGIGAGAFLCEGVKVGPHAGDVVTVPAQPRHRGTSVSAGSAAVAPVGGGYQPTSRIQFDHMTQVAPVAPGASGPHPAREPEPA
jgi:hypothetical protein